MSEIKLLKCPFCGRKPTSYTKEKSHELLREQGYEVTIFCEYCGAKVVKWCDMQGLAWGAAEGTWNNRKPVKDVLKRLESKIRPLHNPNWNAAMEEAIEIIKEELGGAE